MSERGDVAFHRQRVNSSCRDGQVIITNDTKVMSFAYDGSADGNRQAPFGAGDRWPLEKAGGAEAGYRITDCHGSPFKQQACHREAQSHIAEMN